MNGLASSMTMSSIGTVVVGTEGSMGEADADAT